MSDAKLTPEIKDILERSTIDADSVKLPQQLDRKTYEAVNKVLVFNGGKWNRGRGAHVFSRDPREALALTMTNGVAVDLKTKFQQYFTPPDLADELATLAAVEGCRVLEPSAGEGALALACRKFGAKHIDCFEMQPWLADKLTMKGFSCGCIDFLLVAPQTSFKYDRVVMNPPFTKSQDLAHIEHAMKFLKPGGRLVSVILGNVKRPRLQALVARYAGTLKQLDRDAFRASGTTVQTYILQLNN